MVLKNYRYVFAIISGSGADVELFDDANALPSAVSGQLIRRAKSAPGETIIGPGFRFGYLPIQGK